MHSFNRYAYANNNPYKYVDPTGMISDEPFQGCFRSKGECREGISDDFQKIKYSAGSSDDDSSDNAKTFECATIECVTSGANIHAIACQY